MKPLDYQSRGMREAIAAEADGCRAILMTSPCGGGKRLMIGWMVEEFVLQGRRCIVFVNRRLLTKQTTEEFEGLNIEFGTYAAGYPEDLGKKATIASVQTVQRRAWRGGTFSLPFGGSDTVAFFDEAHRRDYDWVLEAYRATGATLYGFTATPVDMWKGWERLIVAGTVRELRRARMLVICRTYSPESPALWLHGWKGKGVRKVEEVRFLEGKKLRHANGEFSDTVIRKWFLLQRTEIFGSVLTNWQGLNPKGKATVLFAPGVAESRWLVEAFRHNGITAAHIDGDTPEAERERIQAGSKDGGIKIVSSANVLGEGVDWPWVSHAINLKPCGRLVTWLQQAGRILRAAPGKTEAILQDHAGAYWRHGSPNDDRVWALGQTSKEIERATFQTRKEAKEPEPICCPQCHGERKGGPVCPHCGFEAAKSVRYVRMLEGKLVKVSGPLIKKRKTTPPGQKAWMEVLYPCAYSGKTLRQAAGWYHQKTGTWPSDVPGLKPECPPHGSDDWNRRVRDLFPWLTRRRKAS